MWRVFYGSSGVNYTALQAICHVRRHSSCSCMNASSAWSGLFMTTPDNESASSFIAPSAAASVPQSCQCSKSCWNNNNDTAFVYCRIASEAPEELEQQLFETRKLSYRKDDRAMCPIYECPENFRESLTMPRDTFPEIFNGFFFLLMLRICVQNLIFVALPVPEMIGGTPKIRTVFGYAHASFSPTFLMTFLWMEQSEYSGQIWSSYTRSWDNSDKFWVVSFERALVSPCKPSIVTFRLCLRVSEILPLLCSRTPLFPTHL